MQAAALVLAAGSARRMGQPKQLLPWGDTTLVRYAVEQALLTDLPVYVVTGAYADRVEEALAGLPLLFIRNPNYTEGLGGSLRVGSQQAFADPASFTHLFVTLADQPGVQASFLRHGLHTAREHPEQLIATAYGEHPGVPAIFPRSYASALAKLGGDAGAGGILRAAGPAVRVLQPPDPLFDIDTPADYRRYHEGN